MALMRRKVIVEPEPSGAGFLIMFDDGTIIWRKTAERVVAEVQKRDREMVRRTRGLDVCVTTIEWRNMPEGFVAPAGK